MRTARVLFACALALASACGDGAAPIAPIGDTGDGDGDGDVVTVGPVIEVLSPKTADDPASDEIVVGGAVEVTCKVTQREGGAAVDTAKVMAEIYEDGKNTPVVSELASSSGSDEFTAKVALAAVPGGKIQLGCSAPDLATRPQLGRALISTFYDSGPVITFPTLMDGTVVALGDDDSPDVNVQFSVKPLPLGKNDAESAVASVVLSIDGQEVEATLDEATKTYVYPLDFQTLYGTAPVSAAGITVTATNKRSPAPATSSAKVGLTVDAFGPKIEVTSPVGTGDLAPIVGARVDVQLKVTDAESGISKDPGKLYATIAHDGEDVLFPLESRGGDVYAFTFFPAQFASPDATSANVTANIHVEDLAGNVGVASHIMRFDTVAPWVSLDPPDMFGIKRNADPAKVECSGTFDPVGSSPEDGQVVGRETVIRALVRDRATVTDQANAIFFAGVDDASVKLIALEADRGALLSKKQDPDGYCDTVGEGREVMLKPVKPAGNPPAAAQAEAAECAVLKQTEATALCESDMTVAAPQLYSKTLASIYATEPSGSGDGCTGFSIDLQAAAGWVCLVAVAADTVGNRSFSAPLRVCRKLAAGDCEGAQVGDILDVPSDVTCRMDCKISDFVMGPTDTIYYEY